MSVKSKIIKNGGLSLEYFVYGNGPQKVLCMHGHGRSAHDFKFLQNKERTVVSIQLFYHGNSNIDSTEFDKAFVTKMDVHNLLKKVIQEEEISTFHWIAFSQGGRFVLSTLILLKHHIQSVSLIAPDGLNDKNFYSWSQRRWWARKLFKRWTKRPKEMQRMSRFLSKLKIISPNIVKFIETYSSDPTLLKKAYRSWSMFRKLRPNARKIGEVLEAEQIPLRIIMGKYDKIIRVKSAEDFIKKSKQTNALVIVDSGHNFFKDNKLGKFQDLLLINED